MKFIEKQETINLVVVPCNIDIATTEALKMAQEVDPEGKRTVGIEADYPLYNKNLTKYLISVSKYTLYEITIFHSQSHFDQARPHRQGNREDNSENCPQQSDSSPQRLHPGEV